MPVKISVCYARKDERLLKELETHLKPLERAGLIEMWYDQEISAGSEWEQEIGKHLTEAQIILLLVSSNFFASDYCYRIEMQRALERWEMRDAKVIPIILRPCSWQITSLQKLQVLPQDGIPVVSSKWHDLDEAFNNVVEGIYVAITGNKEGHQSFKTKASPTPDSDATAEYIYGNQYKTDGQASYTSNQSTRNDSSTMDQAYEEFRRQLAGQEEGFDGFNNFYSTMFQISNLIVKATSDQIGQAVFLQLKYQFESGFPLGRKYISIKQYMINNNNIYAAVFKDVYEGEYIVWTEDHSPIPIVICAGETHLLDLQRPGKI